VKSKLAVMNAERGSEIEFTDDDCGLSGSYV